MLKNLLACSIKVVPKVIPIAKTLVDYEKMMALKLLTPNYAVYYMSQFTYIYEACDLVQVICFVYNYIHS